MAKTLLESSALSAFCESVALMLSAGIQADEAVHMLGENMGDTPFKRACDSVYKGLAAGEAALRGGHGGRGREGGAP